MWYRICALACTQTQRVSTRYLWKIPLEGNEIPISDAFAKGGALRSWGYHCSGILWVQQTSLALRGPTQRGIAGHSCCSMRARRVSLWSAVCRAAREGALVITVFHPGHASGWQLPLKVWEQKILSHLGSYWGKKSVPGCSLKNRSLLGIINSWKLTVFLLASQERLSLGAVCQGQGLRSISQITSGEGCDALLLNNFLHVSFCLSYTMNECCVEFSSRSSGLWIICPNIFLPRCLWV